MYIENILSITGYQGEPVPNLFFKQENDTNTLAMILPGFGYNADLPLLYYPGRIALNNGMDLFRLETAYSLRPGFTRLSDSEQRAWIDADTDAAFDSALNQRAYRNIVIIGKSLGSMAMAHLLERYSSLPPSRWVWLTPVLTDPHLIAQIQQHHPTSLFAIGNKDRYYDEDILRDLIESTRGKLLVITDANHSLEIPESIHLSILALDHVMAAIESFYKLED